MTINNTLNRLGIKSLSLGLVSLILLSGCTHIVSDYSNGGFALNDPTRVDAQGRLNYFLGGIGQTQVLDAEKACKTQGNILQTEVIQTFTDIFIGIITAGIYTPITYRIYCNTPPR